MLKYRQFRMQMVYGGGSLQKELTMSATFIKLRWLALACFLYQSFVWHYLIYRKNNKRWKHSIVTIKNTFFSLVFSVFLLILLLRALLYIATLIAMHIFYCSFQIFYPSILAFRTAFQLSYSYFSLQPILILL